MLIKFFSDNRLATLTLAFLASVVTLMPELAFATGTGTGGGLEGTLTAGLCVVIDAVTGDIGKAIGTVAILILGIGAFFGKVNWGLAIMVALGIVGIFGAAAIAGAFSGEGAVNC